jgi:hypothetical protein
MHILMPFDYSLSRMQIVKTLSHQVAWGLRWKKLGGSQYLLIFLIPAFGSSSGHVGGCGGRHGCHDGVDGLLDTGGDKGGGPWERLRWRGSRMGRQVGALLPPPRLRDDPAHGAGGMSLPLRTTVNANQVDAIVKLDGISLVSSWPCMN